MSTVKQKYIKDENGETFSPIVSSDTVMTSTGNNLSPKCLFATLSGDAAVNIATTYGTGKVQLNNISKKIGDAFSLTNGRIVIGAGVKYVKASALINFWGTPACQELSIRIQLYSSSGAKKSYVEAISAKPDIIGLLGETISPSLFEVTSGDYFELQFGASHTGDYRMVGRNSNTFLFVEKIC